MFWALVFCHLLWERAKMLKISAFKNSWWSGPMFINLSTLQSLKLNVLVAHPLMLHYSFFFKLENYHLDCDFSSTTRNKFMKANKFFLRTKLRVLDWQTILHKLRWQLLLNLSKFQLQSFTLTLVIRLHNK